MVGGVSTPPYIGASAINYGNASIWYNVRSSNNHCRGVEDYGPPDSIMTSIIPFFNGDNGGFFGCLPQSGGNVCGANVYLSNFHSFHNGNCGLEAETWVQGNNVQSESNQACGGINVNVASPPIGITTFSGSSGTLTFTSVNSMIAGMGVLLSGFTGTAGANNGLNAQVVTVAASPTLTSFQGTVTGSGYSAGPGLGLPFAQVTAVTTAATTQTFTAANTFVVGQTVLLGSIQAFTGGAAVLNNVQGTITAASATQFTATTNVTTTGTSTGSAVAYSTGTSGGSYGIFMGTAVQPWNNLGFGMQFNSPPSAYLDQAGNVVNGAQVWNNTGWGIVASSSASKIMMNGPIVRANGTTGATSSGGINWCATDSQFADFISKANTGNGFDMTGCNITQSLISGESEGNSGFQLVYPSAATNSYLQLSLFESGGSDVSGTPPAGMSTQVTGSGSSTYASFTNGGANNGSMICASGPLGAITATVAGINVWSCTIPAAFFGTTSVVPHVIHAHFIVTYTSAGGTATMNLNLGATGGQGGATTGGQNCQATSPTMTATTPISWDVDIVVTGANAESCYTGPMTTLNSVPPVFTTPANSTTTASTGTAKTVTTGAASTIVFTISNSGTSDTYTPREMAVYAY